jgi:hypothetical protein
VPYAREIHEKGRRRRPTASTEGWRRVRDAHARGGAPEADGTVAYGWKRARAAAGKKGLGLGLNRHAEPL